MASATKQLAKALSQGTPIVITTIQKFPFISQALSTLEKMGAGVKIDTAGKRFAVIVDEAHSSQSGETATVLKGMLNKDGIEAAIAAQLSDEEDDDLLDDTKAAVLRDAMQRAWQPNLSFFAFTATPKFKTKALFDEPGPSGTSYTRPDARNGPCGRARLSHPEARIGCRRLAGFSTTA